MNRRTKRLYMRRIRARNYALGLTATGETPRAPQYEAWHRRPPRREREPMMSQLERAWREFRSQVVIPPTYDFPLRSFRP